MNFVIVNDMTFIQISNNCFCELLIHNLPCTAKPGTHCGQRVPGFFKSFSCGYGSVW